MQANRAALVYSFNPLALCIARQCLQWPSLLAQINIATLMRPARHMATGSVMRTIRGCCVHKELPADAAEGKGREGKGQIYVPSAHNAHHCGKIEGLVIST